jgi:hypothetical protein
MIFLNQKKKNMTSLWGYAATVQTVILAPCPNPMEVSGIARSIVEK